MGRSEVKMLAICLDTRGTILGALSTCEWSWDGIFRFSIVYSPSDSLQLHTGRWVSDNDKNIIEFVRQLLLSHVLAADLMGLVLLSLWVSLPGLLLEAQHLVLLAFGFFDRNDF